LGCFLLTFFFLAFPEVPENLDSMLNLEGRTEGIIEALNELEEPENSVNVSLRCEFPSSIEGGIITELEEEEVNSGEIDGVSGDEGERTKTSVSTPFVLVRSSDSHPCGLTPTEPSTSNPTWSIDASEMIKPILLSGMIEYLRKEFQLALERGLENLRSWWTSRSSVIQNSISIYFRADPASLLLMIEDFLGKVDSYLSKRSEISGSLSIEEKEKEMAQFIDQITALEVKDSFLTQESSSCKAQLKDIEEQIQKLTEQKHQLSSKDDFIQVELEKTKADLNAVKENHSRLEKIRAWSAVDIEFLDREKEDLENSFLGMANRLRE
jgi:hypothetical protein